MQPLQLDLGGAAAGQWVGVSDAARLEAAAGRPVNKSSISRFLERNPDVPVRRDDQGRVKQVEYGALSAARASSLSVQDSRALAPAMAPAPVRDSGATGGGSRKRDLEVEKLELDLAERKGGLLDRAAVAMAWEAAGVAFAQSLERRRRRLATELMGMTDLRAAELVLKTSDRALLEQLAKNLGEIALALAEAAPGEEPLAA